MVFVGEIVDILYIYDKSSVVQRLVTSRIVPFCCSELAFRTSVLW